MHGLNGTGLIDSDDVVMNLNFDFGVRCTDNDDDDDASDDTAQTHNKEWTLRMNFLSARNKANLKRRDNACHCRLRDCEQEGTYSVSSMRRTGEVRRDPTGTSSASSSRVGGRSRERSTGPL